jgi:hypothetical protein
MPATHEALDTPIAVLLSISSIEAILLFLMIQFSPI